jgi:phosphate transport system protein
MEIQSRGTLDRELSELNNDVIKLASMVDGAIAQAMDSLLARDSVQAQTVIQGDEELNALRFAIEQECLTILATQQPVATDLRTIITAIHIATELERIGDHATGIARLVERLQDLPVIESFYKLPKMAKRSRGMVQRGIDAYIKQDPDLANAIVQKDEKIDKHYNKLFRETLEEMREGENPRRATYLLWVGHNLERIGDRAINIAERVIFMTAGEFVEFPTETPE